MMVVDPSRRQDTNPGSVAPVTSPSSADENTGRPIADIVLFQDNPQHIVTLKYTRPIGELWNRSAFLDWVSTKKQKNHHDKFCNMGEQM